jgi:DNA polymerase III delta prime subunit
MAAKELWTEKYRPKTLDGYVFQNESQKDQIKRMIVDGDIPHLLLSGTQGSGKTTLAEILINELGVDDFDICRVNASDKTGVDFIRETILNFAGTYPMGKFKIVKLEEFDYLSLNAQGMLRAVLEENAETCRFICTCNYENKIMPAMKSRMQHMRFKAPLQDDVLMRMFEILTIEGIDFDPEVVDRYVSQAYPDIRKIINNLQLNSVGGKLMLPSGEGEDGDYQFQLLDLIISGNIKEIRRIVTEQCTPEQISEIYELLYKNLKKHPKFAGNVQAYEQALCILLDGVYKHSLVAIPHLNFETTCIKLCNSIGE